MTISRREFDDQRRRRFGSTNPERMRMTFWEWMIRGDDMPFADDSEGLLEGQGLMMREGILKSSYGPYRARDLFGIPTVREDGPIWTFDRMGRTRTDLPDGRVICVGGEHEDSYDPDFCIYNDVVVFTPGGEVEIYGYPDEVFPPTDFHSASLINGRIILVGSLGYHGARRPGTTPAFALDTDTYRIEPVDVSGEGPGWIHKHDVELDPFGRIVVRGGQVFTGRKGAAFRDNFDDHALDIHAGTWIRLTDRRWRQFKVRGVGGKRIDLDLLGLHRRSDLATGPEDLPFPERKGKDFLYPAGVEHERIEDPRWDTIAFEVGGVEVAVADDLFAVNITIKGPLDDEIARRIVEDVRMNVQAEVGVPCEVEEL